MGYFLAVSAFRDLPVDEAQAAVSRYEESHRAAAEPLSTTNPDSGRDVLLFAAVERWTIALWPDYFNIHDIPLCAAVSAETGALASAIHVYDSDYWAHSLFGAGVRLDRFASRPGYFAESYSETQAIAASWRGNAEVLASAFGVDAALIGAYLQYVDSPDGAPSKALPDDRFDLDDFWVFTDFWSRAGITYPDDMSAYERVLRLPANFARRLPTMADDEL